MGKRVNQSARTVIGPDVNIPLGWMVIPQEVANVLTIPERVTKFNKEILLNIIYEDKANFIVRNDKRINLKYALYKQGTKLLPNDIIRRINSKGRMYNIYVKYDTNKYTLLPGDVLIRDGQIVQDVQYCKKNTIELNIGDVVERQLKDGDYLYLNRQPTCCAGSE